MKSRDPLTAHHGPAVPRTWPATPSTDTAGQERDQPAIRRRPSPGGQARIRLNRPVRRAVLAAHITSAGAWIGIDVVVAVLVTAGWFGPDPAIRGAAYQILGRFLAAPMLVAALLSALTGLLLGLGTAWGLLRYWWVAVKLVLTVVLCTLIVLLLQPRMSQVSSAGLHLAQDSPVAADLTWLFFPPALSLLSLGLAVVLSVFKPWGRRG